ncbi:unnamed protein product, partial [Aureobasidium pullulans]
MLSRTPMVDESEPVWHRFVRFIAEDGLQYCGQPENDDLDVPVMVNVLDVESSLDGDASFTGEKRQILEAEMKVATPDYPEVFLKPATTISTATAPIVIPKTCQNQVDGEVELAIVIGRDCKDLTLENAMESVLGYTVANDVTARKFQARGSQWGFSKGFDTFCPLGPVLVSKQSLPDPSALELKTTLNGKLMQNGLAKNMIFSIEEILVYLSSVRIEDPATWRKGTVILTGTPSGIGASYDPPIYLQRGADLKVSISHGLGTLVNPVV